MNLCYTSKRKYFMIPRSFVQRSNPVSFSLSSPGSWWLLSASRRRPWPWNHNSSLLGRICTPEGRTLHLCRSRSYLRVSMHLERALKRHEVLRGESAMWMWMRNTHSSPVVASQRSACRLVRYQQSSYTTCPLESHNRTCTASWLLHIELAGLGTCYRL